MPVAAWLFMFKLHGDVVSATAKKRPGAARQARYRPAVAGGHGPALSGWPGWPGCSTNAGASEIIPPGGISPARAPTEEARCLL
jgi:hypothetical protein